MTNYWYTGDYRKKERVYYMRSLLQFSLKRMGYDEAGRCFSLVYYTLWRNDGHMEHWDYKGWEH